MFMTPAYAQAAGGAPGGGELITMIMPIALIMVVFYFLLIRPQQRKMKEHQELISKVARGDTVVTSGGLIGKVTKLTDEKEVQVEVGENVKVRVMRHAIAEVRAKGEPVKAESK
jgi:preprotein translocase subunit YajC